MAAPRAAELAPRSPAARGKGRFALAGACLLVAILSGVDAFSAVAKNSPAAVLAVDSGDANALARRADDLLAKRRPDLAKVTALARASVEAQAINPQGLRILGFAAELSGKGAQAERFIKLSEQTSRRNLGVHLWSIERAVAAQSVKEALRHYDLALRTNNAARATLIERLVGAFSDPAIRVELVPYVRSNSPWLPFFLSQAAASRDNGPALALLARQAGGLPEGSVYRQFETIILGYLVDAGRFDAARQFFASWRGAPTGLLTSAAVSEQSSSERYRPLGWHLGSEASYGASFAAGGGADVQGSGVAIETFAEPGLGGTVASKPLFLAPGRYALTVAIGEAEVPAGAGWGWAVRCLNPDGRTTRAIAGGPIDLRPSRSVVQRFAIPAGCAGQWLDLTAKGGTGSDNLRVTVEAVNVARF